MLTRLREGWQDPEVGAGWEETSLEVLWAGNMI